MKLKNVSRRDFLNDVAYVALAACLFGCTKTVTKYRSDGTPYTVEEDDPVATLAAVILICLIVGAIAASRSDEDDGNSSHNYEGDQRNPLKNGIEIQLASTTSNSICPINNSKGKISVKDSKGILLVITDVLERVTYHNLEAVDSLLTSEQISNLQKPIMIRLQRDNLNSFFIEKIHLIRKPLCKNNCKVLHRLIRKKLYEIKVHAVMDGYVDLEIVLKALPERIIAKC